MSIFGIALGILLFFILTFIACYWYWKSNQDTLSLRDAYRGLSVVKGGGRLMISGEKETSSGIFGIGVKVDETTGRTDGEFIQRYMDVESGQEKEIHVEIDRLASTKRDKSIVLEGHLKSPDTMLSKQDDEGEEEQQSVSNMVRITIENPNQIMVKVGQQETIYGTMTTESNLEMVHQ